MKFLVFILLFVLSFGASAAKITDDILKLGSPGSSDDKVINLGPNRSIRSNETTGVLEFSNDGGGIYKKLGSGSGSGGGGGINLLLNSSFEDPGSPVLNWTNTGGTFTQEDHTNGREGNLKFVRFVSTVAGEYFESDLVTISDDIGPGCMANAKYNQGDNAFEYKVLNDSNVEVSSGVFGDLDGFQDAPIITFPCSGGEQYKLRIISTAAGTIDVDESYNGSNKNVSDASAIEEQSGGFTWTAKRGSNYHSFNEGLPPYLDVDGDIYTYTDDTTNGTRLTFNKYADVTIQVSLGANPKFGFFITLNGTNLVRETTDVSAQVDTGSMSARLLLKPTDVLQVWTNATVTNGQMIVTATTRQVKPAAYTPEQADFYYEGAITPGAATAFNNKSMGSTVLGGTVSISNIHGAASVANTNRSGIEINLPVAGKYEVCSNVRLAYYSANQSHTQYSSHKLVMTTPGTDTILEDRQIYNTSQAGYDINGGEVYEQDTCETFTVNGPGVKGFQMFSEFAESGGTSATTTFQTNKITVKLLSNFASRPIIQDMVTTSTKTGIRTESCTFLGADPTPVPMSDGCVSFISTLDFIGAGRFRLNFAKSFKEVPDCNCGVKYSGDGNFDERCGKNNSTDSKDFVELLLVEGTSGTVINGEIMTVSCKGAR